MPTSTYSLSSAPRAPCSTAKTKRLSAQFGRLVTGSRGSRRSSEDSARRGSYGNGRDLGACGDNSRMRKAAAWMWYTRGTDDAPHSHDGALVVPTHKQLRAVNPGSISSNCSPKVAAASRQPSRFKLEANPHIASHQAASTPFSQESELRDTDHLIAEDQRFNSAKLVNHLFDECELSRLQKLLDQIDIHKLHYKLSAQFAPSPPSAPLSTPLTSPTSGRQIKPLSAALRKLFKIVYATVHNGSSRNSAQLETGRPADYAGHVSPVSQYKVGSAYVQHVIHHHHHHHHHYRRSSLDSPAMDQSLCAPARRRRHSSGLAQDLDFNKMVGADPEDDNLQFSSEDSVCASSPTSMAYSS